MPREIKLIEIITRIEYETQTAVNSIAISKHLSPGTNGTRLRKDQFRKQHKIHSSENNSNLFLLI